MRPAGGARPGDKIKAWICCGPRAPARSGGCGPVGCELAQAFGRLGAQVTIVEATGRLLPAADPQASQAITDVFRAEGIGVRTASQAGPITPNENGVTLALPGGQTVTAGHMLVATGRQPVTDHLGLDAAGVRVDDRGRIVTDEHLATTAPGIYAAGDVTGRIPFTHAAHAMAAWPPGPRRPSWNGEPQRIRGGRPFRSGDR